MKNLVLKLLRMAKKDGDRDARDLLTYIDKNDLRKCSVTYFNSCGTVTYFNWNALRIAYDGRTEEITVFWGDHHWTLCA